MNLQALRFLSPLGLLLLWEAAVRVHLLDARFFPPPSGIAGEFARSFAGGELWSDTLATLGRIAVGFAGGATGGILIGLVAGISPLARAIVDPLVAVLYPIPKIAILPLVLLVFGIGELSKYVLVGIGVFFIMLINTAAGVRQIEAVYLDVARVFKTRPLTFYAQVLLPGALPNIIAGVKLAIGIAIVLAVAAEFTAAKSGLGFTLWNSWQTLQVERMYVMLIVISLLGFVLTTAVDELERVLLPWQHRTDRASPRR